jgi:hypothetical protein
MARPRRAAGISLIRPQLQKPHREGPLREAAWTESRRDRRRPKSRRRQAIEQ